MKNEKKRCAWAGEGLMREYHDKEWGKPVHNDRKLFEFLILEGAQAGLSWSTILKKRENYRKAFFGFDPSKVSRFTEKKITSLLNDPGIVRNKLKVRSAVTNARAYQKVQKEFGSFDRYLWDWVNGKPIKNTWTTWKEIPAKTELSDRISKDLKKRGFSFVGSTIIYSLLQAVGIVNDHERSCPFRN